MSAAHAASTTTSTASAAEVTSPDTDNVNDQQGDQSTADTTTATDADATGASPESGSVSDGPGGHQDRAGDVQHEGGANEQ